MNCHMHLFPGRNKYSLNTESLLLMEKVVP